MAPIPERILYDDVITYPGQPAGHRRRRRRGRRGRRARRRGARGRRARSCARRACSTSTTATQVGDGRKSVALHLVFQSPERTLTDDEVAVLRERIVAALSERFDAELRA